MAELTQARLREVLQYNPRTGVFRWRRDAGTFNPMKGKIAGGRKPPGRLTIRIDFKNYYAHRLAWLYVHGVWPPSKIDHKNDDGLDNRRTGPLLPQTGRRLPGWRPFFLPARLPGGLARLIGPRQAGGLRGVFRR